MIRGRIMSAVIAAGLALGLGVGWLSSGRVEPVDARVLSLLETRCLPYIKGDSLDLTGLERVPAIGPAAHADPRTALVVETVTNYGRRCRITDILKPMARSQRETLYEALDTWALTNVGPLNGGDLVRVDISDSGVGDPFIVFRTSGKATAFSLTYITFAHGEPHVDVTLGYGSFVTDAPRPEGIDA